MPKNAKSTLKREGALLATVAKTPQATTLYESWNDVHITCRKQGFRKTTSVLDAQTKASIFGNFLISGLVGVAIDAGTGAMNKYDGTITIPLVPEARRAPARETRQFISTRMNGRRSGQSLYKIDLERRSGPTGFRLLVQPFRLKR